MFETIRAKLLLQNLLTIAMALVLVMAMVCVALWVLGTRQAHERLALAGRTVQAGFTSLDGELRGAVQRIAGDKELTSKASFLQENAGKPDMASMVVQERQALALRLGRSMAAAGASEATCHGADGALLAAAVVEGESVRLYLIDAEQHVIGVALATGKDPQPDEWKPCPAPAGIALRLAKKQRSGCYLRGESWWMETVAPVMVESLNNQTFQMELVPRGSLCLRMLLGREFIADQEALTGLHVNLYAGNALIAGAATDFVPARIPPASVAAPADGPDLAALAYGSALSGGENRFTAVMPMASDGTQAGSLALLMSQSGMRQSLRWTAILTGLAGIAAALAALVLGWWMSRAITGPLLHTVAVLRAMAAGNTTRRLPETGPRELVDLAQAVNATVDGMQATLNRTSGIAGTLNQDAASLGSAAALAAEAAQRIAQTSSAVASQASHVSSAAQSVATASSEMSASIQEIARNSAEASMVATEAVATAGTAQAAVSRLGQSSRDIGAVVQTIAAIAARTNLLALNATIEAAHAGEVGKGFAVVSSEVKTLAGQAAQAAEDVAKRIQGLKDDAACAEEGIAHIATVVRRINDMQSSVASAVEQQAATTGEINQGAEGASRGAGSIASAISSIATDAGAGRDGAAQTQQAASRLLTLAGALRTVAEGREAKAD